MEAEKLQDSVYLIVKTTKRSHLHFVEVNGPEPGGYKT